MGGLGRITGPAQAVVRQPCAHLLVEPTSALDLRHQLEVFRLVRDYARENAAVVVMALHDLQAASFVSDRILMLANGRGADKGRTGPGRNLLSLGRRLAGARPGRTCVQPNPGHWRTTCAMTDALGCGAH
ncbi:hypothetical protein [Brevundimonas vesicularis]|uniref:Hemin import ATP-binding protein HmuV n=1 Tax=Brevundimonas vesicularis TaxID=41276 RepID=A0A1Z3U507_BREVE|nr:hypothetical protein [Brevundimonas vesicularis]ASE38335.1 hypothetical protein CEP68_01765 [Brevundimonas vesicularis]MDX2333576.1 hypothetical protein [Brevundimonas vesicularis]